MGLENALLVADVSHKRHYPKENGFSYGVYYFCFALKDMLKLGDVPFVSVDRFNLFSLWQKDHGRLDGASCESWVRGVLAKWNLIEADGDVTLLTLPRLFGHVFNPVSFWFCFDRLGKLRAVVSEVCNTFKDRHSYISFHDDHREIAESDILQSRKVFHVSPFMDIVGHYTFRFVCRADKVGVWIDHYDGERLMLSTSLTGKRGPLTGASLMRSFFRYPLVTLKVIALIHYQAFVLLLKGIGYRPRPKPPTDEVTR